VNIDGNLQMQLLEASIIEIVNPDSGKEVNPGEVGEVVVTTSDKTYPLIRLGTGDLAINLDPSPGVSQQKERAIILVGRIGEAVKVRGMLVHPNQLRYSTAQVPGITAIQAIASRSEHRDSFLLKVVLSEKEQSTDVVQENLKQAVKSPCKISIDQIIFVEQEDLDHDKPLIIDQRTWE
jgi:phenylacetate-CoA ligase